MNFGQFKILPEDIQSLDESEKACQYCGVSYLLLSKYERMCSYVEELQLQLHELQEYAGPRNKTIQELDVKRRENCKLIQQISTFQQENENLQLKNGQATIAKERNEKLLEAAKKKIGLFRSKCFDSLEMLSMLKKEITETKHTLKCFKKESSDIKLLDIQRSRIVGKNDKLKEAEITEKLNEIKSMRAENEKISSCYSQLLKSYEVSQDFHNKKTKEISSSAEKLKETHLQYIASLEKQIQYLTIKDKDSQGQFEILKKSCEQNVKELEETKTNLLTTKAEWLSKEKLLQEKLQNMSTGLLAKSGVVNQNDSSLKKDEKITQLCDSIARLNTQIAEMQREREKTVMAHQNRIKQLQESFKRDLEENLLKPKEREEFLALQNRVTLLDKELEEKIQLFDKVNGKLDVSNQSLRQETIKKEEYRREIERMKIQLQSMKKQNESELIRAKMDQQSLLDALKKDAEKRESHAAMKEGLETEMMSEMKKAMAYQAHQIVFLRDTVRKECEERMNLLAEHHQNSRK